MPIHTLTIFETDSRMIAEQFQEGIHGWLPKGYRIQIREADPVAYTSRYLRFSIRITRLGGKGIIGENTMMLLNAFAKGFRSCLQIANWI